MKLLLQISIYLLAAQMGLAQNSGTLKIRKPLPAFTIDPVMSPSKVLYSYQENVLKVVTPRRMLVAM